MKMRIMFYLVLVALFGFAGDSFAMEELPEIDTPEEYAEIIGRQGTEGTTNTFYGYKAGNVTMIRDSNSFFGAFAGHENTNGSYNSFFGWGSGYSNETGHRNVFLGYQAGYNETGSDKLR